ncbi:MAG: cell division protein FtsB [Pseudomonadota bacterium]
MKLALLIIFALVIVLQYSLWYGRGGFAEVSKLQAAVDEQHAVIEQMRDRNKALEAEVEDLKEGLDAVEEIARSELGMIKEDEIFLKLSDIEQLNRQAEAAPE